MNATSMPALHTLLLFAKSIQTNETITRLAFDEFILLEVPNLGEGKTMLLKAIYIRNEWKKLMDHKLLGMY